MKASSLRELGVEDLKRKLAEFEDELFKLRLRRATEELPNPVRLRLIRKDIARCRTLINEKTAGAKTETKNG